MFSKKVSLIFFLLFFVQIQAFCQASKTKVWNAKAPLSWADFKGEAPQPAPYAAMTACTNDYQYWPFYDKSRKLKFRFVVKCNMHIERSWVLPQKQTPELLAHEQLHFDISEYFARQMQIALSKGKYTGQYLKEIETIVQKVAQIREFVQAKYDNGTNHSFDVESQKKWQDLVNTIINYNQPLDYTLTHLPN